MYLQMNNRMQAHTHNAGISLMSIASTVRKVGTPDFTGGVLCALASIIDADACEILFEEKGQFCLAGRSGPEGLFASGTRISSIKLKSLLRETEPETAIVIASGNEIPQGYDRYRHQRVIIAGRSGGILSALHILRSSARRELRQAEINELQVMSSVIYSLVSRHIELAHKRQQSMAPLDSLEQIEACIIATDELTLRESQVCARILYGMSTYGISLDLDIGKESVVTYRKRAYRRLVVSCQRELLVWYLNAYDRQLIKPAA